MRTVWHISDSIVSPLGYGTEENYSRILASESAVRPHSFPNLSGEFWLSKFTRAASSNVTLFDAIIRESAERAVHGLNLPAERTVMILSTTKGNVELIKEGDLEELPLHRSSRILADHLGIKYFHTVSNACISGVLALIVAQRFLQTEKFDHAVVVGADVISEFVVSGFQSLMALSNGVCKPFDIERSGINLGEAAATMVFSTKPEQLNVSSKVFLSGAGLTNDANHISGPSRTGAELAIAIDRARRSSRDSAEPIDFISAHGTATLFNDEMESKAFDICGLGDVPLNSFKSYYGHTLGAAGVLESTLSIQSLLRNEVIPTLGFKTPGVSKAVNVVTQRRSTPLKKILKTASGFGGCNAAIIFEKITE